jgi:hypothetical protein
MSLPRLSLVLAGALFLGFGLVFLFNPGLLFRTFNVLDPPRNLLAEVAAMYGGLEVGLGLFFLVCARRGRWVRPALAAQVAVFGGLAVGRLVGMAAHRPTSRIFLALVVLELVAAVVGLIAFRRAKALMAANQRYG